MQHLAAVDCRAAFTWDGSKCIFVSVIVASNRSWLMCVPKCVMIQRVVIVEKILRISYRHILQLAYMCYLHDTGDVQPHA